MKRVLVAALCLCVATLCLGSCGGSEIPSTPGGKPEATSVPRLSGKPVVAYQLKRPRWPVKEVCGVASMNVIVVHPVSEQELVDLALDLHTRYPKTNFEILDDQSRLKDFDQASDLARAERQLGVSGVKALIASLKPWQKKHYLATIALMAENGGFKWELLGADAHPNMADERICDLDSRIVSSSECVTAAPN